MCESCTYVLSPVGSITFQLYRCSSLEMELSDRLPLLKSTWLRNFFELLVLFCVSKGLLVL